jgi:hypothetical protein
MNTFNQSSDVDILVNGKPVRKYSHNGKLFIEAKEGSEYSIKIRNGAWARKLYITSVDGINVVDGKAGGSSNNGYIINGLNSYEVKGFRVSNEKVNAFKFAKKNKSYAAKSEETGGDTANVGVIGIQVYSEKFKEFHTPIIKRALVADPYPWREETYTFNCTVQDYGDGPIAAAAAPMDSYLGNATRSLNATSNISAQSVRPKGFDIGTEFSKKEVDDQVTEVEFDTGSLDAQIEIYYASRESLIEMGVPVEKEAQVTFPTAFPSKFCKPPRK